MPYGAEPFAQSVSKQVKARDLIDKAMNNNARLIADSVLDKCPKTSDLRIIQGYLREALEALTR